MVSVPSGVKIVSVEATGDELATAPRRIMIMGAHPDDEALLGAGIIKRALDSGDDVYILMGTSGDYNGREDSGSGGQARMRETLAAMSYLGVFRGNIFFLNFPDTGGLDEFGMTGNGNYYAGSSLYRLFMNEDPYEIVEGQRSGETKTYNGTVPGTQSYYERFFGMQVDYNRSNFLMGLQDAIDRVRPDDIYTTSRYDLHGDHAAFGLFVTEAIVNLRRMDPNYSPLMHETFVHSCGSDLINSATAWPKNNIGKPFEYPTGLDERTIVDWNRRVSITVPEVMQSTSKDFNMKYQSILKYPSQDAGWITYFSRYDEFFWMRNFENLALLADVAASSQLSAAREAAKAIDGIADGESTSLRDNVPNSTSSYIRSDHPDRYPTAEWVSNNEGAGAWLSLEWSSEVMVDYVVLYGRPKAGENITSGKLTFSDGAVLPVGELPADGRPLTVKLPARKTITGLTFEVVECTGTATGLAEIEVYGDAIPMDKSILLSMNGLQTFPSKPL